MKPTDGLIHRVVIVEGDVGEAPQPFRLSVFDEIDVINAAELSEVVGQDCFIGCIFQTTDENFLHTNLIFMVQRFLDTKQKRTNG